MIPHCWANFKILLVKTAPRLILTCPESFISSYTISRFNFITISPFIETLINHGYEPQSKLWKLYRSKLRGIIPSAARDCSAYQSSSAAHTELEFHNKFSFNFTDMIFSLRAMVCFMFSYFFLLRPIELPRTK